MQKLVSLSLLMLFVTNSLSAIADASANTRGPWIWGVNTGYLHQSRTDLEDGNAAFSVSRSFVGGSLNYAWNRSTSVGVSVGSGLSRYDFSNSTVFNGLAAWRDVEEQRISLPIRFAPTSNSSVILIPSIRSQAVKGASFSGGATEGLIFGAGFKLSESLTLGLGFGWFSDLEGGSSAFPIVVIDWKITDKLSLETGGGLAASQGPGITMAYELKDAWQISAAVRVDKTQFALDDDNGIVEDSSSLAVLSLNYSPWPMANITAFGGVELSGSLVVIDAAGRQITTANYDTAAVAGLSITARF